MTVLTVLGAGNMLLSCNGCQEFAIGATIQLGVMTTKLDTINIAGPCSISVVV